MQGDRRCGREGHRERECVCSLQKEKEAKRKRKRETRVAGSPEVSASKKAAFMSRIFRTAKTTCTCSEVRAIFHGFRRPEYGCGVFESPLLARYQVS
jgi:hypothetical protein